MRTARIVAVLFAAASLTLITALILLYSMFGVYGGRYVTLTVPDLIGMSENSARATDTEYFEYITRYEYNPEREPGSVISQSPAPDVERKLYSKKERLKITLTINSQTPLLCAPDAIGMQKRELCLALRNAGIEVTLIEEWSDTAPIGSIIYCSFEPNEPLYRGQNVLLKVSKGKQIPLIKIPELCGLSESDAMRKLSDCGLLIGEIKYETSSLPLGRVIAQSFSSGSEIKKGSKIDLTVSTGHISDG